MEIHRMKCMAVLLAAVFAGAIPLTLLYEKDDSAGPRYVEIIVREALQAYSTELAKTGVELQIGEVADYSRYSKLPEFRELAWYAGSNDMRGRMAALQNVQGNVILLVAAPDAEEAEAISRVTPCNTRLFVDINLDAKVESVAVIAIVKWLRRLLGMKVGDPFVQDGSSRFSRDLSGLNLKERFARCAMAEYDQSGEADGAYRESMRRRPQARRAALGGADRTPEPARLPARWGPQAAARPALSETDEPRGLLRTSTPRQGIDESLFNGPGSGIKLGSPLTISSDPSGSSPSFSRIMSSQNKLSRYSPVLERDRKVRRFQSPVAKTPLE